MHSGNVRCCLNARARLIPSGEKVNDGNLFPEASKIVHAGNPRDNLGIWIPLLSNVKGPCTRLMVSMAMEEDAGKNDVALSDIFVVAKPH
jgi:hypothetical protein